MGSNEDLLECFTDDELRSFSGTETLGSSSIRSPRLSRRSSMASLVSVVPELGKFELSLDDLCKYVDAHPSLQQAEIVATECYAEAAGAVIHRFLVLEMHRQNRKDVFLRLDRRRGEGVSIPKFIFWSGKTRANDMAQLASNKASFLNTSRLENRQTFSEAPTLGVLRSFLRIILHELTSYKLWPENCWFFCSMIQQYLGWSHRGQFLNGTTLFKPDLGMEMRQRILQRAFGNASSKSHPLPFQTEAALSESVRRGSSSDASSNESSSNVDMNRSHSPPATSEHTSQQASPDENSLRAGTSIITPGDHPENLGPKSGSHVPKKEDVALARRLYDTEPEIHRGTLAASLGELGVAFNALRLYPEARAAHTESIHLRRQLYAADPRTHRVPLADALHNMAFTLHDLRLYGAARACREECVILHRQLYAVEPEEHCAPLAAALGHLGVTLHKLHHYKEERTLREESVGLYRKIQTANPSKYSAPLAGALRDLGALLHDMELYDDACPIHEESIALYRQAYATDPREHAAPLASALHNLSVTLCKQFAPKEQARVLEEESVSLCRKLYTADSQEHCAPLAGALRNLGVLLHSCFLYEEARAAFGESVILYRQLYVADPKQYCDSLANVLCNMGITLHGLYLYEEARPYKEESVALYREAYAVDPDTHGSGLARALRSLGRYGEAAECKGTH